MDGLSGIQILRQSSLFNESDNFHHGIWVIPNAIFALAPSPIHHISSPFLQVVWLPFPVMGGLWHCFTHITLFSGKGPETSNGTYEPT
jgi:hypothetical protein